MKTKKILATVLAVVLAMGLSTAAFAEKGSAPKLTVPNEQVIGVEGSYVGEGKAETVYSVDVAWGSMTFTYHTTGDKTWNPDTHEYNFTEGDGWKFDENSNKVTVTNHSNAPVIVNFDFVKNTDYKGEYVGEMSVKEHKLAAGVENKYDEADSIDSFLTFPSGKLNLVETAEGTKLGEIHVKLSTEIVEP